MTAAGRSTVRSAFKWSALGRLGSEAVGLILMVVLARLLTPQDYGLSAVLGALLIIVGVVVESGFIRALVQRPEVLPEDENTVLVLNLILGVLMAGAMIAGAPLIASFYGDERLVPLLQVAALRPLLGALGPVQQARLERDMDFRAQAKIEVVGNVIAGVVAVAMACQGFGVWSLVAQMLVWSLVRAVMLWRLRPWRPTGGFDGDAFRRLWPFSSRLLVSNLLNATLEQAHTLMVGRLFGMADTGLYNRAKHLQAPLTSAINTVVGKVSFSAFSRMQDDILQLRKSLGRLIRVLMGVNAMAMLCLVATAPSLVHVLLSDQWSDAVPLLQGFAVVGLLQPLLQAHQNVLLGLGKSGLALRLTILRHVMTFLFLAVAWRYGLVAVVLGLVLRSCLMGVASAFLVRRAVGYGLLKQAGDLGPALIAGALAASMAWIVQIVAEHTGRPPSWRLLVAQGGAAFTVWAAVMWLGRNGMFRDIAGEFARLRRRDDPRSRED